MHIQVCARNRHERHRFICSVHSHFEHIAHLAICAHATAVSCCAQCALARDRKSPSVRLPPTAAVSTSMSATCISSTLTSLRGQEQARGLHATISRRGFPHVMPDVRRPTPTRVGHRTSGLHLLFTAHRAESKDSLVRWLATTPRCDGDANEAPTPHLGRIDSRHIASSPALLCLMQ